MLSYRYGCGATRVTFSVQDQSEPYTAVIVRGTAEVLPADPLVIRQIVAGCVHAAEVDAHIEIWIDRQLTVRIVPAEIRAWRRGYAMRGLHRSAASSAWPAHDPPPVDELRQA